MSEYGTQAAPHIEVSGAPGGTLTVVCLYCRSVGRVPCTWSALGPATADYLVARHWAGVHPVTDDDGAPVEAPPAPVRPELSEGSR